MAAVRRCWGSGEAAGGWTSCKMGGLENKLAGVRRCYNGRGWRWADPCKLGDLENELAGVRRCYCGRGRRWGGSHARCGWSGGLFLMGEPFHAEHAHHLDTFGQPRAFGRPGARSALILMLIALSDRS
jgi:hypothetical protein